MRNEKETKYEQNGNISSNNDDFDCFDHFTMRDFAFYDIFDVVDFLANFWFSKK